MGLLILSVLLFVVIGQEQARAGTPEDSRAALERLFEAAERGDLGVVRRIIEAQPQWLNFPITCGSCLTIAVKRDHFELAEWLLSVDADPEVPSMEYSPTPWTPLQIASFLGRRRMVELLLKWGADVNVTDANGATALHTVFAKDPRSRVSRPAEIVSALVDAGADVNAVDAKGATALHLAVSPPYADKDSALEQVVAVLLERGADPNLRDTGQATPLHRLFESASAWHQGEVIRLLIDAGANAGLTDSEGNTALHILARGKTSAAEARWVALLVGGGADVNAINHHGETALHGVDPANMGESMVRALVAAGADPTIRDASGRTVLALREFPSGVLLRPSRSKDYARALREGDLGLVRAFLDAEPALVSWHLKGGLSALQTASFYRQPEVVELLLARGSDLDAFSATLLGRTQDLQLALESAPDTVRATHYWGATLLHHAAERGFLPCVALLVAQGAQPNLLDDSGHTAWFLAKTNAFGEIADLLAQHGAKPSLMDATALADRQGVEAVLESSPGEVNYRSRVTGMTALHLAAAERWEDGVGLLLRAGAAPDLPAWQLQRPLHYAARYNCAECVRVLTEAGAGTELTDRNGYTPLHFAALFGSLASARSLLDAGADPNAVGSFTPLQVALLAGRLPLVDLLLERGARADLRGKLRHTPLECVRGGILRPELLERFLAEPGLVLQSSTVAVPPQYAVTNQLLSATLEQRIRKALGRL